MHQTTTILSLWCLALLTTTSHITHASTASVKEEEISYPTLPETIFTRLVGTLQHPKDLMDLNVFNAFKIIDYEYGGAQLKQPPTSTIENSTEEQVEEAIQLFEADKNDKATMTLIGYKGGDVNNQINQDRALIVSPYQWWSNDDSITTMNSDHANDFVVGVFDGHGNRGEIVSEYTSTTLPKLLASKLSSLEHKPSTSTTTTSEEEITSAIEETFRELDRTSPPHASYVGGCTASIVLRYGSKLFVANAGDSRSFVGVYTNSNKKSKINYISREDKPNLDDEKLRITSEPNPGKVSIPAKGTSRVLYYNPEKKMQYGLAMSRSIGDWNVGVYGVIPDPIVKVIDLQDLIDQEKVEAKQQVHQDQCGDENDDTCKNPQEGDPDDIDEEDEEEIGVFVVSGTDGLFDFVEPQHVATVVGESLFYSESSSSSQKTTRHPLSSCGLLVIEAANAWNKAKGGRYRDDIALAVQRVLL